MLILASQSPRRQSLLKAMGLDFQVVVKSVDETFPNHILANDMATYLAEKKADAFDFAQLPTDATLIACDTTVIVDHEVLGKADTFDEARTMLKKLSGRKHTVMTGVCIKTGASKILFSETTSVYFKTLTENQIDSYIQTCKPFDKAGAYGIQDWIGLIGIERIEGCYYNVMGLPTSRLMTELQKMKAKK